MKHWIRQYAFTLGLLALFAASFALFVYLTNTNTFADPDSFYHVKLAEDIAQGKNIKNFPWLPFTVLNDYYTDQHFLYHVILVPFVQALGTFPGAKVATTLIASTLITFFAFMLRSMKIRYPIVHGFLLLTAMPFIFRINLVKAPGFSILILLVGLLFAWRQNRIGIFLTAFLYVWAYGGFVLLPVFVIILESMRLLNTWWVESAWLKSRHMRIRIDWPAFFRRLISKREVQIITLVIVGTGLGILSNPFFPANLSYLNDQLIQIGIVNYQSVIQVGGEWYPYDFMQLAANTVILSILVVGAVCWGAVKFRSISLRTWFTFFLYLFFLAFTLKSRRYVEYYAPFGMLFVASAYSDCLVGTDLRKFFKVVMSKVSTVMAAAGLIAYAAIAISFVVPRDALSVKKDFSNGFRYDLGKGASEWLKNNTPEGSIVVHSSWDEFPYLFYWNDHNRYIAGLDPTFSYRKDPSQYQKWVDFTLGKYDGDVSNLVFYDFDSRYVFVRSGHDAMTHDIEADGAFVKVYEDADATVYALTQ